MVCQKNWVSEVRNSWSATYVSNISSAILYHVILSTKSYSKSLKTVEAKQVHILCLSLGLCEGNAICYLSPVDFPHKEQVMRSFDVLLCVSLNKQLSCRWFKMSCDITVMDQYASATTVFVRCIGTLTHCGLVTPYGDRDLGQHWLR